MILEDRAAFYKLKHELLKASSLFVDVQFPAVNTDDLSWSRPTEVCFKPLMSSYPHILDAQPGLKGHCSFMAAFTAISYQQYLMTQLFPDNQNFTNDYCGMFYFQFWKLGTWTVVAVDDKLPYDRSTGELRFLKSEREDVFFFSLLEKAYAKFKGGYDVLPKVNSGEVLVDLTGGVSQVWALSTKGQDWFPKMKRLVDQRLPVTANIMKNIHVEQEGLNGTSTFTLRDVIELTRSSGAILRLVRLRYPWATTRLHTEEWNEESPEWSSVPQSTQTTLALPRGEFWMSYQSFISVFSHVRFCIICTPNTGPTQPHLKWVVKTVRGKLPKFISTATNIRTLRGATYGLYPQYRIELTEIDHSQSDGKCEVVISLMQDLPSFRKNMAVTRLVMFRMRRKEDQLPLEQSFFDDFEPKATSPVSSARENICRLRLPPATYVLVVLSTPPFKRRQYLLRIYKHQKLTAHGKIVPYATELDPPRKNMIPPSSRLQPIGAYDGPTFTEAEDKLISI